MTDPSNHEGIRDEGAKALAGLLKIATQQVEVWEENDLPSLWQHQLDTALEEDMCSLAPESRATFAATIASGEAAPETYRELITAKRPPIALLSELKNYAKKMQAKTDFLPREIGLALYYVSIALAQVRLHMSISSLDRKALDKAFTWGAGQEWLDDDTRELFNTAMNR